MFLLKLANFLRGYLIICIDGCFSERFLNICANRGILMWDIKRRGDSRMTASISIPGFKKIAPVARKSHCRVSVEARRGLPFVLQKGKKRYAFLAGMLLFFCLIFVMSGFIWGIDIKGNEKLLSEDILAALEKNGLHTGAHIRGLDVKEIRNNMMLQIPEISWLGINIKGTTAHVEVRERAEKPEIVDETKAYNIIAGSNGVITEMNVLQGTALVKEGDVVYKGQILVSGAADSQVKGVRFVASSAEIRARTWHEKSMPVQTRRETKSRTGEYKSLNRFKIFGININLFLDGRIPYENYDKTGTEKQIMLGNLILPFSMQYDKFYEVEVYEENLDEEQAFEYTFNQLCDIIEKELEDDTEIIQSHYTEWTDEQGQRNLTVTYECIESIVTMEEILYEQNGEDN